MKKLISFLVAIVIVTAASAQPLNPVNWDFTCKKVGDGVFEVYLTANIQSGWHLYSQMQPKDAIAQPTSFSFNKNPLLDISGNVKEKGKMEKYKDEVLGVTANQYSNRVVFVQKVKVKGNAKTALTGKLEFQTCDDKKCLPPKTVNFSIALI